MPTDTRTGASGMGMEKVRRTRNGSIETIGSTEARFLRASRLIGLAAMSSALGDFAHAQDAPAVILSQGADPAKVQSLSHVGPWLVDSAGRVVQLHGLTLYQKRPPFLDVISDADLDYAIGQGFNTFRINWMWEAAEPEPGRIEDGYIDRIAALNDQMARHGIRTLIGPANNSYSSRFGGFGAPPWATINRQYCTKPEEALNCLQKQADRYLGIDGEFEAWDNFYDNVPASDNVGVLTHFTKTWQRVASRLDGKNNVFALALFHEPAPGLRYVRKGERRFFTEPVTFEREGLGPFYKTVGDGVRQVAAKPTIFFQISDYYNMETIANAGIHVPRFSADANLGLSYHFGPIDIGKLSSGEFAGKLDQALTTALDYSRKADVAFVMTGYRLVKNEEQYAAFTDHLGGRFVPWIFYTFKGMPNPGAENTSLLLDPSQPASDTTVKSHRLDSMVVPYPQLTAGTPQQWSFDRATRVARFSYSTLPVGKTVPCGAAATEIFVPQRHYPHGYFAEVSGGRIVSQPTSAWLVIRSLRRAREVSVTIRPREGSFTERPATALGPTANARCQ